MFDYLVSYRSAPISLTGAGDPVQLRGEIVSWDLFPLLEMQPNLGLGFRPEDEDSGAPMVTVGHSLWKTKLGGDVGIIDRTINLDREPLAMDARFGIVQPMTRQRGVRMLASCAGCLTYVHPASRGADPAKQITGRRIEIAAADLRIDKSEHSVAIGTPATGFALPFLTALATS